ALCRPERTPSGSRWRARQTVPTVRWRLAPLRDRDPEPPHELAVQPRATRSSGRHLRQSNPDTLRPLLEPAQPRPRRPRQWCADSSRVHRRPACSYPDVLLYRTLERCVFLGRKLHHLVEARLGPQLGEAPHARPQGFFVESRFLAQQRWHQDAVRLVELALDGG